MDGAMKERQIGLFVVTPGVIGRRKGRSKMKNKKEKKRREERREEEVKWRDGKGKRACDSASRIFFFRSSLEARKSSQPLRASQR